MASLRSVTHWLLVDYENLQPVFRPGSLSDARVVVFHGAQQQGAPAKLKSRLASIDSEFVRCTKTGKNALDFHLTYYLGRLAAQHPKDDFYVLSKDKATTGARQICGEWRVVSMWLGLESLIWQTYICQIGVCSCPNSKIRLV